MYNIISFEFGLVPGLNVVTFIANIFRSFFNLGPHQVSSATLDLRELSYGKIEVGPGF